MQQAWERSQKKGVKMSESRAQYNAGEEAENWPEMMIGPLLEIEPPARCGNCGMWLSSWAEYHPVEFCVLYRAGFKPWDFVTEVLERIGNENQ